MPEYREIVIVTYVNRGEPSASPLRAHPVAGQGFPMSMNVECSEAMRMAYEAGTHFVVRCKLKSRAGGLQFLYTSWQWPWEAISPAAARAFVARRKRSATGR